MCTQKDNQYKLSRDDRKRHRGLTLCELIVVVAILGLIGSMASLTFQSFAEKGRIRKSKSEIASIQTEIKIFKVRNGSLPDSLADVNKGNFLDPWGTLYQYNNLDSIPKGKWRKDKNLVPLNSDYDLWSNGKDGNSEPPLTAKASYDDIIRANNGAYIGIASKY